MGEATNGARTEFERLSGRLFGIAYRMLGSRADAEDVIQEAYVRWHQADQGSVRSAEAWLVTTVTRLAIDRLRALQRERETYRGPWLPEPLLGEAPPRPDDVLERAADLSIAFLTLLERLAPEERAAFLLHDVFDCGYPDIARILQKSEAACRQLVHRARERVRSGRRRFDAPDAARARLVRTFRAAVQARDEQALLALFAPDATWTADGGGVAPATPRPLAGAAQIVKLVLGLQKQLSRRRVTLHEASFNGETGLCARLDGALASIFSFETDGERITAVYAVVNPAKLPGSGPGSLPGDASLSQEGAPHVSGADARIDREENTT